ncbi:MAG TPA: hypothetical protein VIC34_08230 [Croceibacterium sp.]|jgi:hypothetical protein
MEGDEVMQATFSVRTGTTLAAAVLYLTGPVAAQGPTTIVRKSVAWDRKTLNVPPMSVSIFEFPSSSSSDLPQG